MSHLTSLGLSRVLLRALIVFSMAIGVILVVAFVVSFVFEGAMANLYRRHSMDAAILIPTARVWMLIGLSYLAVLYALLSRLLEIVETVRVGDPFVPENAVRLKKIAWFLLIMQLLQLSFGVVAKVAATADAHIYWRFSISGWVAVVLLFVLARVFEEGTRIRDNLEAMI